MRYPDVHGPELYHDPEDATKDLPTVTVEYSVPVNAILPSTSRLPPDM